MINVQKQEWKTLTTDMQNSIKDSITKVKSSGASDEKITLIVDKAYDDFVKHAEAEFAPTIEGVINITWIFVS